MFTAIPSSVTSRPPASKWRGKCLPQMIIGNETDQMKVQPSLPVCRPCRSHRTPHRPARRHEHHHSARLEGAVTRTTGSDLASASSAAIAVRLARHRPNVGSVTENDREGRRSSLAGRRFGSPPRLPSRERFPAGIDIGVTQAFENQKVNLHVLLIDCAVAKRWGMHVSFEFALGHWPNSNCDNILGCVRVRYRCGKAKAN